MKKILKLIFCVAVCEAVGIAGGLFTAPAISSGWYAFLEKPFFSPPNWLFGPAWILLYALMGIALRVFGYYNFVGFDSGFNFQIFQNQESGRIPAFAVFCLG